MSISDFQEQGKPEPTFTEDKGDPKASAASNVSPEVTPSSPTVETVQQQPVQVNTTVGTTPVNPSADDILNNVLGRIGDIGSDEKLKLMILGPPGNGKSSLVGSAKNCLAYDFEDGLISAKGSPHGIGEGTQSIPYKNMEEFRALVGAFANGDERLAKWDVFAIDTLSDLHKRDLAEITEREWRKQPSRNRYVPDTDNYQEVNERIVRVVRALRDLPVDIIITSHSKTVEPKSGPSKTYADFSESLSNKVMAMMDIVGYLQFKEIDKKMVPVLRVKTDGVIYCKSRVPMPDEIVNPTYSEIKRLWVEGLKNQ